MMLRLGIAIAIAAAGGGGCGEKKSDEGRPAPSAAPVAPGTSVEPLAPAAPPQPFATLDEAATAVGAHLDAMVAALDATGGVCADIGSSLAPLESDAMRVAARLGVRGDPDQEKQHGMTLLEKISCVTVTLTGCISARGVAGFFRSPGWVTVRSSVMAWAGKGVGLPPCAKQVAAERALPHPAGISDAAAAEQEALTTSFEEFAAALATTGGDCKAGTKLIKAFSAKTPMDAHAKRMAVAFSEDGAVNDWYSRAQGKRIGRAAVAASASTDVCATDKAYAAAGAENPFVAYLLGF